MLKKIGLVLLAVTFALLVFPGSLQKKAQVERRITIKTTPSVAYAVLADFHQFRSWDPWSEVEPESSSKVEGQGVGAVYSWEGEKIGSGQMVIKDLKENERVDVRMIFKEPFASEADNVWSVAALENGETEVVWSYQQDFSYFERFLGLTMGGMIGGHFESGLARLKARLEAKGP